MPVVVCHAALKNNEGTTSWGRRRGLNKYFYHKGAFDRSICKCYCILLFICKCYCILLICKCYCILFACSPVSHQVPWLVCAPAPVCPRWRSPSGAPPPLAPGPSAAPRGFDSPAAPWSCPAWWTVRAASSLTTTAEGRTARRRCVLSTRCYDWRGKKKEK